MTDRGELFSSVHRLLILLVSISECTLVVPSLSVTVWWKWKGIYKHIYTYSKGTVGGKVEKYLELSIFSKLIGKIF